MEISKKSGLVFLFIFGLWGDFSVQAVRHRMKELDGGISVYPLRYQKRKEFLCPPTEPFLCPGDGQKCISLGFVCDGSPDCPSGYDENRAVCAAAKRPPVQETTTFLNNLLKSHGENFLEKVFGADGKNNLASMGGVQRVAVLLSESPTITEFASATKMSAPNADLFRKILVATESGNLDEVRTLGINDNDLADIKFFLDKLIATGFVN